MTKDHLDFSEQIARIDKLLAEHDKTRQDIRIAPWQIAFSGMTAGAAFFAAGIAFAKLFG